MQAKRKRSPTPNELEPTNKKAKLPSSSQSVILADPSVTNESLSHTTSSIDKSISYFYTRITAVYSLGTISLSLA